MSIAAIFSILLYCSRYLMIWKYLCEYWQRATNNICVLAAIKLTDVIAIATTIILHSCTFNIIS